MEAMAIIGIILLVLLVIFVLLYIFAPWIFYDLGAGAKRFGRNVSDETHVVGEKMEHAGEALKEKIHHAGEVIDKKIHPEVPSNIKKFVDLRIDELDLVGHKEFSKLQTMVDKHYIELKEFKDDFKTAKVHIDDIDLRISKMEGKATASQKVRVAAEKAITKAKKTTS